MDVVHPRCAGVDVSKRDAKVCVRVARPGRAKAVSTVTTWGAVTNQVLALRDHLIAEAVTLVVMEATSDYWKPFYYLLDLLTELLKEFSQFRALPLDVWFMVPARARRRHAQGSQFAGGAIGGVVGGNRRSVGALSAA